MNEVELNQNIKKRMIDTILSDYRKDEINEKVLNKYLSKIDTLFDYDDMAIIGISCELPDAKDHVQFWGNLMNEKGSIRHFPDKRAEDYSRVFDFSQEAKMGGYLDDIDQFDAEYFKIPPKMAEQMDPYHRKILEVTKNCIEDAGYYKEQLFNTKTGVFIGHDQTHRLMENYFDFLSEIDFSSILGAWTGMLASRVSHLFNLKGPAMVLDSGCSSAMVAIDTAINSIKNGDCEAALVGGINLFFWPDGIDRSIQSSDNCFRNFDHHANGTIWSEGVACIYIKPLSKAIKDRDHIYGVIKGIALNNDGKTASLTALNKEAQKEVILSAWEKSGITAEDISYIESHGTGTVLGDLLEVEALTEAFEVHTQKKQFCGIGSVKSNIGHTVGLSGIAALIKVLMSFKQGIISPTINFNEPNQLIDFLDTPLYIQNGKLKWTDFKKEMIMGINCFSFTGTNAHLVTKSYSLERSKSDFDELIFPLSAKNSYLMIKTVERLQEFLNMGDYEIEDISYTMSCCRKHQDFRAVIITDSVKNFVSALDELKVMLYKDESNPLVSPELGYRIYYDHHDMNEGNHQELDALALKYVNQENIDFLPLFDDMNVFKCSLPPSEFDRKRFWDMSAKKKVDLSKVNESNEKDVKHSTSVEELLQDTWSEILGYEQIEKEDDFFELGGDSISGFKITGYLSEVLQLDIPGMSIFNYPVFADFLDYILDLIPTNDVQNLSKTNISNKKEAKDSIDIEELLQNAWSEILGYEQIEEEDDFFELGGDSISGFKITGYLSEVLQLDIPGMSIFNYPIFSDFLDYILDQVSIGDKTNLIKSAGVNNGEEKSEECLPVPLISPQRGVYWTNQIMKNDGVDDTIIAIMKNEAQHSFERIIDAVNQLTKRHDVLRAYFFLQDGTPVQAINHEVKVDVDFFSVSSSEDLIEQTLKSKIKEISRLFDLNHAPLLRVYNIIINSIHNFIVFDIHHIITDGTSMGILISDFEMLIEGKALPEKNYDYPQVMRKIYQKEEEALKNQLNWWLDKFKDGAPVLNIATDRPHPPIQSYNGFRVKAKVNKSLLERLKTFASKAECSLYMVLLGGLYHLICKLTNETDHVIGTVSVNRNTAEEWETVGMFVNALPLRFNLDPNVTVLNSFQQLKQLIIEYFSHQEINYEALVEEINVQRSASRSPLFDIYFALQNVELGINDGEKIIESDIVGTKFDMTVVAREEEDGLVVDWDCRSDLFNIETIEKLALRYTVVLEQMLHDVNQKIGDLNYLLNEEESMILTQFNDTYSEYPREKTVVHLFEEQVEKTPENVAVVFEEEQLTYKELNARANALAHKLRELGVGSDDCVAIMAERSIEMIIGIYGIIKAGGAYVPLDSAYSLDQIHYILEDCRPKAILTNQDHLEPKIDVPVIHLKDEESFVGNVKNPEKVNEPNDLIYLIYTSGVTEKPKGIMVEHQNIVQLLANDGFQFDFNENDSWLMSHSFSFAFSIWEMFGALLFGSRLVMISKEHSQDSMKVLEVIKKEKITVLNQVPTAFYNLMEFVNGDDDLSIRYLIFGGETLNPRKLKKWHEQYPEVKIINMYGATETTVHVTYREIGCIEIERGLSDIGSALPTHSVYIRNDNHLCGIGIQGELCVSGAGITRGYLNQPELTAEKFVDNPYGEGKLYRTGDLGRWLPDGNIEYLGRIDDQVKIRGYRVELKVIENVIIEVDEVLDAVVVAREDENGEKAIYAYFTSKAQLDIIMIQGELRKELPDYMIPLYIKQIEQMPITLNGKLDLQTLPDIESETDGKCIAPRNEIEETLCLVFKEVLGIDSEIGEILGIDSEIGIDDNFFELGGDSIKAILIISKLRERGYQTDVRSIMQNRTPRRIGEIIEKIEDVLINQGEVVGVVALTPIQKDFILNDDKQMHHFNQSMLLESQDRVDQDILKKVLNELVKHHDMLRATYRGLRQEIKAYEEDEGFYLYTYDYRDIVNDEELAKEIDIVSNDIQSSFNLESGPLLKVGLFQAQTKDYLLFCIHHLVVDGVSWRILIEDFKTSYQLIEKGDQVVLPQKTNSFQEWSQALGYYHESERLKKELPYWQGIEENIESGNISPNGSEHLTETKVLSILLSEEQTSQLMHEAPQAYHAELNDILLTSIARGIAKVTGNTSVSFNMEGHGREEIGEDIVIDRTVGWFTTMYPVVIKGINKSIKDDLCDVKETLRRIPNHGIGYGVLKSLGEKVLEGIIPTVTFNYLGEFVPSKKDERFVPSRFSKGNDVSEENTFGTDITIDSVITEGKLSMMISYDAHKYTSDLMSHLQQEINQQLADIIAHCLSITSPEHTASDFEELGWSHEEFEGVMERFTNQGYQLESILPLTEMQEGMLYHKLLNPESTEYVTQAILSIKSPVSEEILRQSFDILMKKHQALRISIVHKGVSEPRQALLKERSLEFTLLDLSDRDPSEEVLQGVYKQDVLRGFDLETDSLMRLNLIKVSESDYRLIMSFYHIIMDGWCTSVMMNDFLSFYTQLSKGRSETQILNQLPKQKGYSDYIRYMRTKKNEPSQLYWEGLLEGYEGEGSILPLGVIDEKVEESMRIVETYLTEEEVIKLEELAQNYNVTLNTIVEAAWGILLGRYNHQKDAVFGKVVSGRDIDLPGVQEMLGLFINTIPVRVTLSDELTFGGLITDLQKQALRSGEHDHYSLAEIQKLSGLGSQLIQTTLAFENYLTEEPALGEQLLKLQLENIREETNYDLSLVVSRMNQMMLRLMYNPNKYGESEAQSMIEMLKMILQDVWIEPEKNISAIEGIAEEEKTQILSKFNNTYSEYPNDKTVIQLFEEQVEKMPDHVAVIFEDEEITYRELNMRANALAYKLRDLGVEPDDYVGIMAERSVEMIIGIYGIIKSGGAYVPLDPTYPLERIQYMLEDCNPKVVLTYQAEVETQAPVIDLGEKEGWKNVCENPIHVNQADDLIYCLYTSGTTGKPKGVMIENKNIINYCHNNPFNIKGKYITDECRSIVSVTAVSFDIFVTENLLPLLNGMTIILANDAQQNSPVELSKLVEKHHIDALQTTPSKMKLYLSDQNALKYLNCFKVILLGGEPYDAKLSDEFKAFNMDIVNVYGPTETTVWSAATRISDDFEAKLSVGRPISNTQIYMMNDDVLCGIGVSGELCIAGAGVARGYLNRPELTAEKFVDNPYGEGKLYRTGDLARWLPDGNIEHLGRIDEQVKIRGFRIELGEIERVLREVEGIKDCAVTVREDTSGELAINAYVVSDTTMSTTVVKDRLRKRLPEYMIPAYMTQIDAIPLTRNGKLDRRALPEIEVYAEKEYVAPRTELEEKICTIFKEILDICQVGINDSFFELGGHSLRATRLVNRIEVETGVRVALKSVFSSPTVEGLAELVLEGEDTSYMPIPKAEEKDYYEMSSAQKRIYLLQEMDLTAPTYNMPQYLKLIGEVRPEEIKRALQELIDRHEILRTSFKMLDGELVQCIQKEVEFDFEYVHEGGETEENLMLAFVKPFELSQASQLRAKIVNMGNYHLLMIDMHHIISDGMSIATFINEFTQLYNKKPLEELTHQFKDYSEWMGNRDLSDQRAYWIREFSDETPVLDLPLDDVRPKEQSFEGAIVGIETGKALGDKIKGLARQVGSTEYMVFLASAMVLLGTYANQEDVVIGSPISGRIHKDTEQMLGMFVNTLAMRGRPERNKSFEHLLEEVKASSLKAYENGEYPFEELVESVEVRRDLSRNPLFDVMLVMQNNEEATFKMEEISAEYVEIGRRIAKFDLTFNIWEVEGNYRITLEYRCALFKKETIELMLEHYVELLNNLLTSPAAKLKEVSMMTKGERRLVLEEFNDTYADYPRTATIVQLFENQVKKTPENIAVVFEDDQLTYRELNARANVLACRLRELGVGPDDYVAIMAERNIEMIIGIFGIIKAGGAYVPLDPAYPKDRMDYILEDCQPKVLLIGQEGIKVEKEIPMIVLKGDNSFVGDSDNLKLANNPEVVNKSSDLAYLIYTSGTTGRPKGVMVEHRSVLNLVGWKQINGDYTEATTILQNFNYIFDGSVWEIFPALLSGCTLEIISGEGIYDIKHVLKSLPGKRITMTPSMFKMLVDYATAHQLLDELNGFERLYMAGEALSLDLIGRYKKRSGSKLANIFNAYGPTEATVCATIYRFDQDDDKIRIGSPIANTQVHIMNDGVLCGIGIPGELCIAGDGLARGYLNRPELTAEKFVDNPYGEGKLYRSGDKARWLLDGSIEYLGRIDEQVKIRGFRIELGEIESSIREIEEIKDCAVIARVDGGGEQAIYGYVVSDVEVSISSVKNQLEKLLPDYMVPAYMTQIDSIPITRNGKLDKQALPEIKAKTEAMYTAPRNEKEGVVCWVFKEILGLDSSIGIDDSFFTLGGDSIKAIRIVSKLRESGYQTDVRNILENKTPRKLAEAIEMSSEVIIDQGEVSGMIALTPIQKDFILNDDQQMSHFNQSMILESHARIDEGVLRKVLNELTRHHDMLRATYQGLRQEVKPFKEDVYFDLYSYDDQDIANDKALEKQIEAVSNEIQRSINLETGPLFKVGLFQAQEKDYLLFCIHHLVIDGVSWRVLIEDFAKSYQLLESGEQVILPQKTNSYQDWSEALVRYLGSEQLKNELPYWKEVEQQVESGNITPNRSDSLAKIEHLNITLSKDATSRLMYEAPQAYHAELSDLLLTSVVRGVSRVTGQNIVSINMEGHGREEIGENVVIDRTVGWFTSVYPVVIKEINESIEHDLYHVKETLRRIPNHGIGYGVLKSLGEKQLEGTTPTVTFNYLGEFISSQKDERFVSSQISSGNDVSEETTFRTDITINGAITKGMLHLALSYDTSKYSSDLMSALQQEIDQQLADMIAHCLSITSPQHTASDFGELEWSHEEFTRMMEKFAE